MSIVKVLMTRDKVTFVEACEMVEDARKRVAEGEDPEEVLHDEFGLEPDYFYDLL